MIIYVFCTLLVLKAIYLYSISANQILLSEDNQLNASAEIKIYMYLGRGRHEYPKLSWLIR